MGKAARLRHRAERQTVHTTWPRRYIAAMVVLAIALAAVAYAILDRVGTSWVAPAGQGWAGRTAGVLVSLAIGVLAILPLTLVLDWRHRRQAPSRQ